MSREIFAQLRKTDTALTGKDKNQPVIIFRYGRWLMLTVGVVINPRMKARRGIVNIHFMSNYRARKTIREWLPYSRLTPFDEVCPAFRAEVAAKVLPAAEDYRSLLTKGWVVLAGGFTTDTLCEADAVPADQLIAAIDRWMQAGEMGPFLHFENSWDGMVEEKTDKP